MSFNDGRGLQIVGSSSIRSQQYAGDYDGYQVVEMSESSDATAAKRIAHEWQANIKRLRALPDVFIGDIKCGEAPAWRIIPEAARLQDGKIVGYNPTQSLAKVDQLETAKIISPAEAIAARKLLPARLDIGTFLQAKQTLKFHVIRWTPREILAGRKKLRDGGMITLAQACSLPGMAKMDVIAKVQNSRFTDFSVIYEFRNKGHVLNPYHYDVRESLREAVVAYRREGDSFKALKRIYTLARYENDQDTVRQLTPILNSDLGRLYHITSDMRTLVELLQQPRVPIADIRYEVDQFVGRLSGIYKLEDVLKNEGEIIGRLHTITKMAKGKMAQALDRLADQLEGYLQYATEHTLKSGPRLTGGGPYTEMLLDEGERVFGTRDIREWPGSARAAYQKAKQILIEIGPTAGAFTPQQFKLAEIRRFAAAIAAPVNPMYSHGLSAATATAAAPAPAPAAASAAAPRAPHSKMKMVFDPKPVGRGKMKGRGDDELEGGVTVAERQFIAARARYADIVNPINQALDRRDRLRPVRDDPARPEADRRRAAHEMAAILQAVHQYQEAYKTEIEELEARLRPSPRPDLTPGRPLEGRPYPHQRPPIGKSPLSR